MNDHARAISLTESQLETMIRKAASEAAVEASTRAIRQAFAGLGIDVADPDHVRAYHADMSWLRSTREGTGRMSSTAVKTIISSVVAGIVFVIWQAIKG